MGIVKTGPFMNYSTDQEINILNRPITRGAIHKILRERDIPHDPHGTKEKLWNKCMEYNIDPYNPPPIGEKIEIHKAPQPKDEVVVAKQPEVKMGPDGWPKLVPVLRVWCKERGIMFKPKWKRVQYIEALENYARKIGRDDAINGG